MSRETEVIAISTVAVWTRLWKRDEALLEGVTGSAEGRARAARYALRYRLNVAFNVSDAVIAYYATTITIDGGFSVIFVRGTKYERAAYKRWQYWCIIGFRIGSI